MRRLVVSLLVAALAAGGPGLVAGQRAGATTGLQAGTSSAFRAMTPVRLLDTRAGERLAADGELTVPVAGRAGVPNGATAVVLNVTATDASAPGFLTVFPSGTERPPTSALNVEHGGDTVANLATVPLGTGGSVTVYSSSGTEVVLDAFGYYVPTARASAGRFVAVAPGRVFDSRTTRGLVAADETVRVALGSDIPVDAAAVAATITVTDTTAPGYWTVWAAATARPGTSNVNVTTQGETVANQVIVPVADGSVDVYSEGGGHVIVDITGYFTGPSAPEDSAGLFVPVAPQRLLDTRDASAGTGRPSGGRTIEVPTEPYAAVVANLTVVDASQAAFVTAYPAGTPRPETSNVNVQRAGQTAASDVIVGLSDRGLAVYLQSSADLLVDLSGYFTGSAAVATIEPDLVPDQQPAGPGLLRPDRLTVPSAGIDVPIGFGVDQATLAVSPGFWPAYGWPGQPGNVVIGGHRTTHGGPFRHLDDIQPGDDLWLDAQGVRIHYVATTHFIVEPTQVDLVVRQTSARELTLFACHPVGSEAQRYVVRAVEVEE